LEVPEPDTPGPVIDNSPVVSASVTEKLSPVVVPLSERLTPEIDPDWPTPTVAADGAAITGTPSTVTAMVFAAAVLPKPSVAVSLMVSVGMVPSPSVSVASAAFTWLSEPVTDRLEVPEPDTPGPVIDNSPVVSASATEKVSPVVVPLSERLTPEIEPDWPTPTVAADGAAITGTPFTVTAMVFAAAVSPTPSVAVSLMVSVDMVPSPSVSVASAAFTWLSEPVTDRLVVPEPDTPAPIADRLPLVSVRATEKVSPVVVPLSERLTPEIEPDWPTPTVAADGAAITGTPSTVTALVFAAAVLPK